MLLVVQRDYNVCVFHYVTEVINPLQILQWNSNKFKNNEDKIHVIYKYAVECWQ